MVGKEEIESRLLAIIRKKQFTRAEISQFQEVMASCADKLDGQALGLGPVCPFCRSRSVDYGEGRPLHAAAIPEVTFTAFKSLSEAAKTQRLTELWKR